MSTNSSNFLFFFRAQSIYSQWHHRSFTTDNGEVFNTAEQFMMVSKARLFGDHECATKIMTSRNPLVQKRLGRKVKNFNQDVWEANREAIVFNANMYKFAQHPDLKAQLMATGEREIVEASPYDNIWGIGLSADDPRAQNKATWKGMNLLGIAITNVRRAFKNMELINSVSKLD